jgi:hypothetical protein
MAGVLVEIGKEHLSNTSLKSYRRTNLFSDDMKKISLKTGKRFSTRKPNRVGVSLHLRAETDPVSETSCFSSNYLESGRWTKSENPVILCVVHHRQNPTENLLLSHENPWWPLLRTAGRHARSQDWKKVFNKKTYFLVMKIPGGRPSALLEGMHGLGSFNHWNRRLSVSVFRCSTF